jgi:undecaprenyl-diphosphatase
MNFLQIIILGLVQGFSEFLPISSSGHLILINKFFGWTTSSMSFDVFLHLGTLVAVFVFLRSDVKKIFVSFLNFLKSKNLKENKLWLLVLVGILPAGMVGLWMGDLIEGNFRNIYLVAFDLIFFGFVLWFAEKKYEQKKEERVKVASEMSIKKSLMIGLWQVLALLPGTSRSGITITGGMFAGLDKETAVRFSFLMSIPLILGANILKVKDIMVSNISFWEMGLGFLVSFLAGLVAIKWLVKIASAKNFKPFVVYRIILGVLILLFL